MKAQDKRGDAESAEGKRDEYGIIQPNVGDVVYSQSKNSCLFSLPATVVQRQEYGATLDYGREIPVPHEVGRGKRYWALPLRELDFSPPSAELCESPSRPGGINLNSERKEGDLRHD